MSIQPAPLSAQLAELRANAPSGAACGMLSNALHALIAAIFARIFSRLEQIVLLWQAGHLPAPPAPRAFAPRPSAPRTRTHETAHRGPAGESRPSFTGLSFTGPPHPRATPACRRTPIRDPARFQRAAPAMRAPNPTSHAAHPHAAPLIRCPSCRGILPSNPLHAHSFIVSI